MMSIRYLKFVLQVLYVTISFGMYMVYIKHKANTNNNIRQKALLRLGN